MTPRHDDGGRSEAGDGLRESIGDAEVLVDEQGRALHQRSGHPFEDRLHGRVHEHLGPFRAERRAHLRRLSVEGSSDDRSPDGTRQVTFDGKPLYSFVEDGPGGDGDGGDSFGGTEFVWTVARTSEAQRDLAERRTDTSEEDDGARYGY